MSPERSPEQGFLTGRGGGPDEGERHTYGMTPTPQQLSLKQQQLVVDALRKAAALELALGNPQAAGLCLVEYLAEERMTHPETRMLS